MKKTWTMSRRLKEIISRLDDDNLRRVYFLASGLYAGKKDTTADQQEVKRLEIIRTVAGIEEMAALDMASGIIKMVQSNKVLSAGLYQDCVNVRSKLADIRRLMQGFMDIHTETMNEITNESAKSLLSHSMESLNGILALMDICVDKLDSAIIRETEEKMNADA